MTRYNSTLPISKHPSYLTITRRIYQLPGSDAKGVLEWTELLALLAWPLPFARPRANRRATSYLGREEESMEALGTPTFASALYTPKPAHRRRTKPGSHRLTTSLVFTPLGRHESLGRSLIQHSKLVSGLVLMVIRMSCKPFPISPTSAWAMPTWFLIPSGRRYSSSTVLHHPRRLLPRVSSQALRITT